MISSDDDSTNLGPEARRRGIAAAIACVALVGMGLSLSVPLLSLDMERMGISSTGIGLNTAVAGLASILTVPFVPALAARIGVGRLLWICVATIAGTMLLFRAIPVYGWWFPIRFLFSVALGALFVLSEYWINALAPPARRGFVMGIYATVLALGFAAGPAILALAGTSGWPPYLAGAALYALAGLPLLLGRGATPALEAGHGARSALAFLIGAPLATLAALLFGGIETGAFTHLPLYGLDLGHGAEQAALLVSLMAIGNVLFQIPIGLLADRFDKRFVLLGIAACGLLGAGLMSFAATAYLPFAALLVLWGGIVGALYTVGLSLLGARYRGADLAGANAAFVMLYGVGLIAGPIWVGAARDLVRPHGFAYALMAMFAVYLALGIAHVLRANARSSA